MLTSFDLFSGIGGFTLGLKGMVKPLLYCEIDPFCQSVLMENMRRGRLPQAPIVSNIKNLDRRTCQTKPDIITAGFPCQDASQLGTHLGLAGDRTGLVRQVVRICKQFEPNAVFLENVAAFQTRGMQQLLKMFTKLGYESNSIVMTGTHVGAPHLRRRWFCLLSKRRLRIDKAVAVRQAPDSEWKRPYPAAHRLTSATEQHRMSRCKALGNAVIPQVVRQAFCLLTRCDVQLYDIYRSRSLLTFRVPGCAAFKTVLWPTPLAAAQEWSGHGGANNCSRRNLGKLKTRILYETNTRSCAHCMPSPRFVEHLMGYPRDYTVPAA